jgi:hypothetical protein
MRFTRSGLDRPIRVLALASLASLGLLAFSQPGCATPKQSMESSVANTSGEGTVEAKAGPNDNTQIEVRVKHLSAPARVASDASVYVVWIQPRNAEIQNVGALQVDADLVGKLNTTTPHRTFTLTVTPEPSARMAAPTHGAVFTAEVNRAD